MLHDTLRKAIDWFTRDVGQLANRSTLPPQFVEWLTAAPAPIGDALKAASITGMLKSPLDLFTIAARIAAAERAENLTGLENTNAPAPVRAAANYLQKSLGRQPDFDRIGTENYTPTPIRAESYTLHKLACRPCTRKMSDDDIGI